MPKHCCSQMEFHINKNEKIIRYMDVFREYAIVVDSNIQQEINFCPWCGVSLPKSLREEFFEVLVALNIEIDVFNLNKAPLEFRSDEWWRNRKL